jgi:23S rRNA pseudouridine1911/1915/1917 synthase
VGSNSKALIIEILPGDAGRTLPAVLHDRGSFTHSEAKGLIDAGAVRGPLGGRREEEGPRAGRRPLAVRPGDYARRVEAGERYEVRLEPGRRYRPKPPPRPGTGYKVVHEDRDLLVVEKEPRLLSVPTPLRENEDSLVERLLESERERGVRHPALYALHRLDWDTSGLLLFARSRRAFEALEAQFKTRTIERLYVAVASGSIGPDEGRIESRLLEDKRTLKVRSTRRPGEGKEAITEYRVTERLAAATVLAVRLRTGRRNQIRVHLAEAGHPLIGDRSYGRPTSLIGRTALHARSLRFIHPVSRKPVAFESPLPRDMRHLIKTLRRGVAAPAG